MLVHGACMLEETSRGIVVTVFLGRAEFDQLPGVGERRDAVTGKPYWYKALGPNLSVITQEPVSNQHSE